MANLLPAKSLLFKGLQEKRPRNYPEPLDCVQQRAQACRCSDDGNSLAHRAVPVKGPTR